MKIRYLALSAPLLLISCMAHDRKGVKEEKTDTNLTGPNLGTEIVLSFSDSKGAAEYLDLASLGGEACKGKECLFADLEPTLFSKNGTVYTPTDDLTKKFASDSTAVPKPKVVTLTETKAVYDAANSIVYGSQDRLAELSLDEKCSENVPFAVDSQITGEISNIEKPIEKGTENLSDSQIGGTPTFVDLRLSGIGKDGTLTAGAEITAKYKSAEILGSGTADFEDYENLKGKYVVPREKLSANVELKKLWKSFKNFFEMAVAYAALNQHPGDFPLPTPGYGGDPDAFVPTHPVCGQDTPSITVCSKPGINWWCDVKHEQPACDARKKPIMESINTPFGPIGGGPNPMIQIYNDKDYCEPKNFPPVSAYYTRKRSPRVAIGAATIDCRAQFPKLASDYSISSIWQISVNYAQWFVTDSNWPGCGGASCPDKFLRNAADDSRGSEVEPYFNHCIDRWSGIDYNDYSNRLANDCKATQIFKDAEAAKITNDADASFASACSNDPTCSKSVQAMAELSNRFSLQTLELKLTAEENSRKSAKESGKGHVIQDQAFSSSSDLDLTNQLLLLETGIDSIERFRNSTSPIADWNRGLGKILAAGAPAGFSSHVNAKETIAGYKKALIRVKKLSAPSLETLSCSFESKGRFRIYQKSVLTGLKLVPGQELEAKSKLLKDYTP